MIDGVSWRILVEDLFTVYTALVAGQPAVLQAKTMSFHAWANQLEHLAQADSLRGGAPDWTSPARSWASPLPVD